MYVNIYSFYKVCICNWALSLYWHARKRPGIFKQVNADGVAWTSATHIISCSIFTRVRMKVGDLLSSSTCQNKVRWCCAYSHKSRFTRQTVLFLKPARLFAQISYTMWAGLILSRLNCSCIFNFSTFSSDLYKRLSGPNNCRLVVGGGVFLLLFFVVVVGGGRFVFFLFLLFLNIWLLIIMLRG